MQHIPQLSRIAAEAIIAQMTMLATDESTKCADIDGVEYEFTLFYSPEWHSVSSHPYERGCRAAECAVIGGWVEDTETGTVLFAGNRLELEAFVGEKMVSRWDDEIAEDVTERGGWA